MPPALPHHARLAARMVSVLVIALLMAACSRGSVSSPQGDPAAAQRAAQAEARQQQAPPGQQAQRPPTLLGRTDLSAAYRLIVENYVDRVDHVQLIEAARTGVKSMLVEAGALPADYAALDFLPLPSGNADRDWSAFIEALDAVIQRHREWSLSTRPDYEAIRQMARSLDDNHTVFLTAEEVRRQAETSYSGIGVRFTRPDPAGPAVIMQVVESSPAALSGLRVGDRILAVGDRQVAQLSFSEIANLIRGPQGTEVSLQVERTAAGAPFNVKMFRRPLAAPDVEVALIEGRLGYIRIYGFTSTVAERVGRFLVELDQQGAAGLILDLRGNPGGDLGEVAKTAGYFLEPRPIGISVDRNGDRQALFAEQRPRRYQQPIVALVDGGSGFGAEVLAAALKEYQRAALVGQKTSGNVGIAAPRPLSDGSALQLTVRRLQSPTGAELNRVGVQPDEVVGLAAGDIEAGRDPQLERSLQLLRQRVAR